MDEWYEEEYSEIEDDDEDLNEDYYESESEEEYDINYDTLDIFTKPKKIVWKEICLNGIELMVCTNGKYKYKNAFGLFDKVYDGIQLQGTPFKYIYVNEKKYFMHDLIWQTFYGSPKEGYLVRHKHEYTKLRPRKVYSNNLANLEVYKEVIDDRILPINDIRVKTKDEDKE
ncbi:MAG: hypothetical protein EBU66_15655 [Bacteroidetes bacterium]|nr:hypothetical protein [Bacteroidota bacterium]